MNDDKKDPLQRYIKGMNSIQPSLLDPFHAMGWKAANKKPERAPESYGEGTVELLMKYSKGKTWTKWTALLFGICALIYAIVNSYSLWASIGITLAAAFCGFVIPGLMVFAMQLAFYGVFALIIFLIITWLL